MAKFSWEATDRAGERKSGTIDAPSQMEVEKRLTSMGLTNPKIKKKKGAGKKFKIPGLGGVPTKTKVVFTRQLATMIDAGLPLVQCMELLAGQEPNPEFRQILVGVKASIESGSTFADALAKHPDVFDNLFTNLVSAGEMGGILDTILNRLAIYMEKAMKLRQKVKGAMKYPVTVLIISLVITMFLLVKVIPTFGSMFESMGKELPALTAWLISLSDSTIKNLPTVLTSAALFYISFKWIIKQPKGQLYWHHFLLKLPAFGDLLTKAAVAKFTRTLGTLVSSGVPILDALEIVAKTSGNVVIENAIMYTRDRIAEGKSIAGPLMEQDVFPKMVVQMVAVGESTGAMDIMLSKIADFYEDEVDTAVDSITSLIEPLIMVVLGTIIGTVLIAMYLPIFSMADGVG